MSRLGVLGGGQLGRMMAEAGHRLGIEMSTLDPGGAESPMGQLLGGGPGVGSAIKGSFRDPDMVRRLASQCDVLTVEIEHVDVGVLKELAASGTCDVQPTPETIEIIQDKYAQKLHMSGAGVPCGEFVSTPTLQSLSAAGEKFGYPLMLKSRRLAYDGRGNAVVKTEADARQAWDFLGGGEGERGGLYAEKWVPFTHELASMVVRAGGDRVMAYPVVQTVQRDNICHTVIAPAPVAAEVRKRATDVCSKAIAALGGRGIFGVEVFALSDGSVLFNEVAPRPHNSGHYTIEACEIDQFDMHVRAVLQLPCPDPKFRVGCAAMVNVLGRASDAETRAACSAAMHVSGAGLHWYGKSQSRPGRKMAHITITAPNFNILHDRLLQLENAQAETSTTPSATQLVKLAPLVGVIMGSDSDLPCMSAACKVLEDFKVPFECTVVSAHRTPQRLVEYAQSAEDRGVRIIIAGAGGAAHLPGMVAAMTSLPVIGVPVKTSTLSGNDSLLSIVQMPRGVPVATVAIGNATNAGLLAVRIVGAANSIAGAEARLAMAAFMSRQREEVQRKAECMERIGHAQYLERYNDAKANDKTISLE